MKTITSKFLATSGLVLALAFVAMLFGTPAHAASAQPAMTTVDTEDATLSSLLHMREEEKLAHDVYVTLYDMYGMQVFDNISQSESQHMSAVLGLLDARGIADPVVGNGLGEFTDPDLQSLYTALVDQGSQSLTDALIVGATIEDLDIADLQAALASELDADIQMVYQSLLNGSENHLRAFVRNLDRSGASYEPQYISGASYDSIVSASNTNGSGNSSTGRGGRQSVNSTDDDVTGGWGRAGRNR